MHQQNNGGRQTEKDDGAEIETVVQPLSRLANVPILISISIPLLFHLCFVFIAWQQQLTRGLQSFAQNTLVNVQG
jgi:hypothetical protein